MEGITRYELSEAHRSIASTLSKCEKVQYKLKEGSPQMTLTRNRINAFKVALVLIERELENTLE